VSLISSPANSSRVQRARPSGGLEQAVATSRASLFARDLTARSWARRFAQRCLQVAEHEALLGPVDGRAADAHAGRNRAAMAGSCSSAERAAMLGHNRLVRGVLAE
jgi:hypothetical protein